jgi:hypothetical protein
MKTTDVDELKNFVAKKDMANIFHIYEDTSLDIDNAWVYNVMRALYIMNLKDIPKSFFSYHKVMEKETWNMISYKLYGTVELWWLLLKLNEIKDPTFDPTPDSYVRYISKENANQIIDTMKTS